MSRVKGSLKTGGRKKGSKNKSTLQTEMFREFLFQEVMKEKGPLVKALIKAGKKENVPALKEILERILGRIKEPENKDPDITVNINITGGEADKARQRIKEKKK